jgi:predicted secreted protein
MQIQGRGKIDTMLISNSIIFRDRSMKKALEMATNSTAQFTWLGLLMLAVVIGCADPDAVADGEEKKTGIIGKKTQEVGEFKEGDEEADLQVKSASPLASAGAYGFAISQISKMTIDKNLQLFHAMNERYPKDHEEFMEKIIKGYNIQLPKLPGGRQYQYDVENHELKVVEKKNAQRPEE